MATDEKTEQKPGTTEYVFQGSQDLSQPTERLIVKGSVVNPIEYVDKGGVIALSDDEVKSYREQGLKFRKSSDSEDDKSDDEAKTDTEAKREQAESQVASGAQAPAANLANDNTPGGRALKGK